MIDGCRYITAREEMLMLLYEFFQYNMALLFDVDDDDDLWVSIITASTLVVHSASNFLL